MCCTNITLTNFSRKQNSEKKIEQIFSKPLFCLFFIQKWHYHILLNQKQFTEDDLQTAISQTVKKLKLSDYCLQLDQIENHLENAENYCIKELKVYFHGHFDSDRIILSAELFQLPYNPIQ